jgi:excisionase family DNA binding protein
VSASSEKTTETQTVLTPRDVSEALRVSVYTVRRWFNKGDPPAYKVGRGWRIGTASVAEWLNRDRSAGSSQRYCGWHARFLHWRQGHSLGLVWTVRHASRQFSDSEREDDIWVRARLALATALAIYRRAARGLGLCTAFAGGQR